MLRALRELAFLVVLVVLFLFGLAFGWGASTVINAALAEGPRDISPEQWVLAQAEEVCVDGEDLVAYLRSPPYADPATELFVALGGERALAYLRATGSASFATTPKVLYFLIRPAPYPGQFAMVMADGAGCLITVEGERTPFLKSGNPASSWAQGVSPILVVLRNFRKLGFPWPGKGYLRGPELRPVSVEYDI